jgi:hypothetical protein
MVCHGSGPNFRARVIGGSCVWGSGSKACIRIQRSRTCMPSLVCARRNLAGEEETAASIRHQYEGSGVEEEDRRTKQRNQ